MYIVFIAYQIVLKFLILTIKAILFSTFYYCPHFEEEEQGFQGLSHTSKTW